MRAIVYDGPGSFSLREVPTPDPGPGEVRIRVVAAGLCGTDLHLHEGQFLARYPLTPGHETVGVIDALGEGVTGVVPGEFVAVNPNSSCGTCRRCREGQAVMCREFTGLGSSRPGGFADFMIAPVAQVISAEGLDPDVAVFAEPVSCVMHAMDVLATTSGRTALVLGAGPTGIAVAQLIGREGTVDVTIAATTEFKLDRARALGVAHSYLMTRGELDDDVRALVDLTGGEGYDIVVEATGNIDVCQASLDLARDGGTVVFYGVADEDARITVSPYELFRRELTIRSSFCEIDSVPDAIDALRTGRINTDGIITHRFTLEQYEQALHAYASDPTTHKIVITP